MTASWWLITILCCGTFAVGTALADRHAAGREEGGGTGRMLPLLLAGGLLIRLALAWSTKGYEADINTFSAWAGHAAEGLTSFYSPGYFADYPPGYIYVLWGVGKLRELTGADFASPLFLTILKLPTILSDLGISWLLFRLAKERFGGNAGIVVAALWLFNPTAILDSAVWGQVDGVLTFFILLGVLLLEGNPAGAGAAFTAALLVKPQALIFAPVPLLWFGVRLLREGSRKGMADLLYFTGTGTVLFSIAIFPFAMHESPGWIVGKYGGTLASYPYATLNAYNLFALMGANALSTTDRFIGLPYGSWGTIFILLIVLFSAAVALRGREASRWWYLAAFLPAATFVLSAKMHERYLFPAIVLLLGWYAVSRSRSALWLCAGFTVTQYLNIAQVLALSYREIFGVPRFDPLLLTVSLANVLLLILLVNEGRRRYLKR